MAAKKPTKKRRRRKGRYKRGVHISPKATSECRYRSGWELVYLQHLDADPEVLSYSYEGIVIEYVSNVRTKKIRKYYPDVFIEKTDGSKILIEIKPKRKLVQGTVQKKLAAAKEWCSAHGVTLEVITEIELKLLGLL